MGIEILYNPDYLMKVDEKPIEKKIGRKLDHTCSIEWGVEIITKHKRIKIFYQKR